MLKCLRRLLQSQPEPLILLYHRIAESQFDPWGIALGPSYFAEHLALIRLKRTPLSMKEFVSALKSKKLPRDAIAVTFDDGYRDTLTCAKPLLEDAKVPATVFLTTGSLGIEREFWWDELARLVLGTGKRVRGSIEISGEHVSLDLPMMEQDEVDSDWRAWEKPGTPRQNSFIKLWNILTTLDGLTREAAMRRLRERLGEQPGDGLPMRVDDIANLLRGPMFQIGAHSVSHRQLTSLSLEERRIEILESKHVCEKLTGRRIEGFAYPYGKLDESTRDLVEACGFEWACSTREQPIQQQNQDAFVLPRIQWRQTEFPESCKRYSVSAHFSPV
jgi:peptidoglycan/xylan/chitin deacetylase (PgdA/CDA1 family)